MKRKSFILAVLAAAASAAVVAAVSFAAGGGSTAQVVTLHLIEKDQSFHFVDNPPLGGQNSPPSPGDQFVFGSRLLTLAGKRAGALYATCTQASGGNQGVSECFGTFRLAGGDLQAMASIKGEPNVTHIAVLGGTGAYAGMRGTVDSVNVNSNTSRDTITLTR
jgi:hypothetical protein